VDEDEVLGDNESVAMPANAHRSRSETEKLRRWASESEEVPHQTLTKSEREWRKF
jgi:hypothetical protein